jgi:cysteine-rich repeat protein
MRFMRVRALVLVVAATACVRPDLVDCPDGRACPASLVCDTVHHTCVASDQLAACGGLDEGAHCTYGGRDGSCIDGVCFGADCGDRVVEPGEACDDGNRVSGDGCNADCRSNEACGNAFVDLGEACDDGNLRSADGCDSRCQSEELAWSISLCGSPSAISISNTIYDQARHVVVVVDGGMVRDWDGQDWRCASVPVPTSPAAMTYDSIRHRAYVVTYPGPGTTGGVAEWDGAVWTSLPSSAPPSSVWAIAFDSRRGRIVAVLSDRMATFDPLAGTWQTLSPGTTLSNTYQLVYDETHDQLVAATSVLNDQLRVWSEALPAWTPVAAPPGSASSLTYDPDGHRLLAFNTDTLYAWDGTTSGVWSAVPASTLTPARSNVALAYDPATHVVIASGGRQAAFGTSLVEFDTWNGSTWTMQQPSGGLPSSSSLAAAAALPSGHVIVINSSGQTFSWDGSAWSMVAIAAPLPSSGIQTVLASDPILGRMITLVSAGTGGYDTWAFDGAAWERLNISPMPSTPYGLTFDRDRGAIVATSLAGLYVQGPTGWTLVLPPDVAIGLGSLAYDTRKHCLVSSGFSGTFEVCRGDSSWGLILGTGSTAHYVAVTDEQRGSVFVIDLFGRQVTWERVGDLWRQTPPGPFSSMAGPGAAAVAVDLPRQQVLVFGLSGRVDTLRYSSGTPLETCAAGEDGDGDGLAGCADGDCWWSCRPTCPPYATCP